MKLSGTGHDSRPALGHQPQVGACRVPPVLEAALHPFDREQDRVILLGHVHREGWKVLGMSTKLIAGTGADQGMEVSLNAIQVSQLSRYFRLRVLQLT